MTAVVIGQARNWVFYEATDTGIIISQHTLLIYAWKKGRKELCGNECYVGVFILLFWVLFQLVRHTYGIGLISNTVCSFVSSYTFSYTT